MSAAECVSLAERLSSERALLEAAFGGDNYQIYSSDSLSVIVRSDSLEWTADYHERDGSLSTHILAKGVGWEEEAGPWLWALFLGEEIEPLARDASGRVAVSVSDQLRSELRLLVRLLAQIFSLPETARDAAHFVRGYTKAHNDRASGARD